MAGQVLRGAATATALASTLAADSPVFGTGTATARGTGTVTDFARGRPVARPTMARLEIGDRLGGRYEIRGYLGEGGMGAVYRAFDSVLGQEVALKSIRGAYASESQLREEVRVAQQITHLNVCRTFDLVELDGRHFVKMECIIGETLAHRIVEAGALPIAEAIRIARAVAVGLAAAHAKSIIHRDLKPSNVMLSGARVVLMDFGLARAIDDEAIDRSGTPSYMSPEQLAGTELDERSDLFALGCLIYEMLTGKRAFPHAGSSYTELISARAASPAPDVIAKRPDAPHWLVRSVAELLSHDAAEREDGVANLIHGPGRRWWLWAVAGTLLALAGVVTWWAMRTPAAWQPRIEKLLAHSGNADVAMFSPDGKTIVLAADPANTDNKVGVYVMPTSGGELRRISPGNLSCFYPHWTRDGRAVLMTCTPPASSWTPSILRMSLDGGVPVNLGVGWEADDCGDALAITRGFGENWVLLLRFPDGRESVLAHNRMAIERPRCTRDATHVGFLSWSFRQINGFRGRLTIVDREGRSQILADSSGEFAFTSGDRSIVFTKPTEAGSTLHEITLATGTVRAIAPTEEHARAPEVSPDGTTLLFNRDITWHPLYELDASGDTRPLTLRQDSYNYVVAVPGTHLVVGSRGARSIDLVDVSTGVGSTLTDGFRAFPSHDGTRIYFAAANDLSSLHSVSITGGVSRFVARLPEPLGLGADAADGIHLLLAGSSGPEAWVIPTGQPPRRENAPGLVIPARSGDRRAIWSALTPSPTLRVGTLERQANGRPTWVDDRRLSYCDETHCRVLDVETGAETLAVRHPFGISTSVAAPDGKRWFYTPQHAQVSLHKITNFAERY